MSWPATPSAAPPGASRDRNEALLENHDTVSALVVDPTLIAVEMHAGNSSRPVAPSFPAATTVAIPTERRLSTVDLPGAVSQFVEEAPPPRLRFTEAML